MHPIIGQIIQKKCDIHVKGFLTDNNSKFKYELIYTNITLWTPKFNIVGNLLIIPIVMLVTVSFKRYVFLPIILP